METEQQLNISLRDGRKEWNAKVEELTEQLSVKDKVSDLMNQDSFY